MKDWSKEKPLLTLCIVTIVILVSCNQKKKSIKETAKSDSLHVVFVTGDEEYRSEESMPMLAKLVARELNAKVTVCYAVDSLGYINPNETKNIKGLEALKSADLMVAFMRYREIPERQRKLITDYVESGKPIVGFRTSTHAFKYKDSSLLYFNNEWPTKVFGQQWITHHGHFDDGKKPLTYVTKTKGLQHPILNGIEPFDTYSWLYHVDGGNWSLYGDCEPLLYGTSLKSHHEMNGKIDEFPLTNPVAWTKSYKGKLGNTARVFFTTLGHPYDFKAPVFRTFALNGVFWALGKENEIPKAGVNSELDAPYNPNNSGFGEKYKKNRKP